MGRINTRGKDSKRFQRWLTANNELHRSVRELFLTKRELRRWRVNCKAVLCVVEYYNNDGVAVKSRKPQVFNSRTHSVQITKGVAFQITEDNELHLWCVNCF